MGEMLTGAIAFGWLAAGGFFFRFWRHTHDKFFLYFALSFWLECGNRIALGIMVDADEGNPGFYLVRLVSYGLIILAIWQKNRRRE